MGRAKHSIGSFSYSREKEPAIDEFEKIAEREGKSFSELVVELIEKYSKEHGDGNPNYELTQWAQQPDFKVTPAFFAENEKWDAYLKQCSRQELAQVEGKSLFIRGLARKLWLEKRE